ncbi:MAG: hypothetical protein KC550_02530 [Nanoarchaeota archaeon]|nr:hypothetical protein [Nanoarchaeota archaeon]
MIKKNKNTLVSGIIGSFIGGVLVIYHELLFTWFLFLLDFKYKSFVNSNKFLKSKCLISFYE